MTFLDAYGLVAFVADESAADEVEQLLRDEAPVGVVVGNLAEAIDISQRVHGLSTRAVQDALEPLFLDETLASVTSHASDAWQAAALRSKHYDRKACAVSLADCFLLGHAMSADDAIATSDPALAGIARAEGVRIVALPDRRGDRP